MRAWAMALLLCLGVSLIVVVGVAMRRRSREEGCRGNFEMLWKMAANYMVQNGGPQKRLPPETAERFWIRLMGQSTIRCPFQPERSGCDYRGPAIDVCSASFGDDDPICADVDGNHGRGRGGNVWLRSGEVLSLDGDDPRWLRSAKTTCGGNPPAEVWP